MFKFWKWLHSSDEESWDFFGGLFSELGSNQEVKVEVIHHREGWDAKDYKRVFHFGGSVQKEQ